jgi:hypothetical protein
MTYQEYVSLLAERTTLKQFLAEIPADEILDRSSFEGRLEEVEEQLARVPPGGRPPARARLTFRGRPVVDGYGIFADFGTKATSAFTSAVMKVGAALSGPLAPAGPAPQRDQSQLLITSTAIGSFGFELEEYRPEQVLFAEETATAQALEVTRNLLQSTLGSDEELADSAADTDPRAIEALRTFLDILVTNEAVCALEYAGRVIQFRDVGEVRQAVARLSEGNLQEAEVTLRGAFRGVLPEGRQFEFQMAESGEVILGKVAQAIADPAVINQHLHEAVSIRVLATRVGKGKPRHALLQLPTWPGDS